VFLQFACLAFMPLGDALTLVFTEPLWTIILSKIILRTRVGWWKGIFAVILIAGMVLTIQPEFMFHNAGKISSCNVR
jgi:drug/metabolite transporter (DMT)-like permease